MAGPEAERRQRARSCREQTKAQDEGGRPPRGRALQRPWVPPTLLWVGGRGWVPRSRVFGFLLEWVRLSVCLSVVGFCFQGGVVRLPVAPLPLGPPCCIGGGTCLAWLEFHEDVGPV